jgi:hypothetical protein
MGRVMRFLPRTFGAQEQVDGGWGTGEWEGWTAPLESGELVEMGQWTSLSGAGDMWWWQAAGGDGVANGFQMPS